MSLPQHMDYLRPGRGLGSVLPEAVKEAGAEGVMLNHADVKLTLDEMKNGLQGQMRLDWARLLCADTVDELMSIAKLSPNLLVAEPTGAYRDRKDKR